MRAGWCASRPGRSAAGIPTRLSASSGMNRIIGWTLLSLCVGSNAAAQVIRGAVTDRSTGSPIRGAFVALLRQDGRQATGVLTGSAGEFVFRVPAGTYSLRAERIGLQTT